MNSIGGENNTSGHGPASKVPLEVMGWSWGAFFLNWIWGLFNGTFIALLCFVPLINFVMIFVLGAKGNEWAWRNKQWTSVEQFKSTQKKWALAGVICFFLTIIGTVASIGGTVLLISSTMQKSAPYKAALNAVKTNPEIKEKLGENIELNGMIQGSISTSNSSGKVDISIPLKGSKGKGKVYIKGEKEADVWKYSMIKFGEEDSDTRIDLLDAVSGTTPTEI